MVGNKNIIQKYFYLNNIKGVFFLYCEPLSYEE